MEEPISDLERVFSFYNNSLIEDYDALDSLNIGDDITFRVQKWREDDLDELGYTILIIP